MQNIQGAVYIYNVIIKKIKSSKKFKVNIYTFGIDDTLFPRTFPWIFSTLFFHIPVTRSIPAFVKKAHVCLQ